MRTLRQKVKPASTPRNNEVDVLLFPAKASVDEFITMMAGGLAGATPHTISATITAISRLVFEFKGWP